MYNHTIKMITFGWIAEEYRNITNIDEKIASGYMMDNHKLSCVGNYVSREDAEKQIDQEKERYLHFVILNESDKWYVFVQKMSDHRTCRRLPNENGTGQRESTDDFDFDAAFDSENK